jgi:DNA-binding phage protein
MLINNKKYVQARENICRQLRETVLDNKISVDEIALKTGLVKSNVNRVLNGMYAPKLDHVIAIADVIGFKLTIQEVP